MRASDTATNNNTEVAMVGGMNINRGAQPTLTRSNNAFVITIQRGDTLTGIAARYGTSVAALLAANPNVRDPDRIFAGQALAVPRASSSPSPSSPSVAAAARTARGGVTSEAHMTTSAASTTGATPLSHAGGASATTAATTTRAGASAAGAATTTRAGTSTTGAALPRRVPDVAVNVGAIQRRADVANAARGARGVVVGGAGAAGATTMAPASPTGAAGATGAVRMSPLSMRTSPAAPAMTMTPAPTTTRAGMSAGGARAVTMSAQSASTQGITAQELSRVVPNLSDAKAQEVAGHLTDAMREAHITTVRERAAFVAQLAHESGGFYYMEEIASGAQYEGRTDLGNTQPGDGVRYKGRGYIQITGRSNYRAAGQALGLDLENHPELASQPENAARIAAWYWNSRNINDPADRGDFVEVTRRINGGTNGLASRQAYYDRALSALDGAASGGGAQGDTYVVAAGDTLSGIAARFGTSLSALLQANPQITNPDRISVGDVIHLPSTAPPRPAIDAKLDELGGASSFLGQPLTVDERTTPDGAGRFKDYENGSIYWTQETGAHEVHGAIRDAWAQQGYERGDLGYPVSDEQRTADGAGRFSVFQGGSVYWSPSTGAHEVKGAIRDAWAQQGYEGGALGYPVSGEEDGADGAGKKSRFQGGTVLWSPATGAHEVHGKIGEHYDALGGEGGFLGYPMSDEQKTPDGAGRFNVFQGGSVYWSPSTGAHEVHGAIRDKFKELGWERGMGYPTSDEYDVPEGRRSDFENGSITWDKNSGAVTVTMNPGVPLPAPVQPPPAPPAPTTSSYTVRSGDTLSGIAGRFGTTVGELMGMNPQITNPDRINAGDVITVPGAAGGGAPVTPTSPNGWIAPNGDLVPNQFALGGAVGQAACGPAALVALERAHGIDLPLSQAVDIARNYGWNTAGGMNGFGNFINMSRGQGLDFRTGGLGDVRAQVEAGHPVIISTNKHYFVAQKYDPATGKYFCGNSGTVYRNGAQWLTLDQIASLGNGINGVGWSM